MIRNNFLPKNMNELVINGAIYKMVCMFRKDKNDRSKDAKGETFPVAKEGKGEWTSKKQLVERLKEIEAYLDRRRNKILSGEVGLGRGVVEECQKCKICGDKCVGTKRYNIGNYVWEDGLGHYVDKHNVRPPEQFVDKLFSYSVVEKPQIKLFGRITRNARSSTFMKLDRNQIMILDALMKHGGYTKKYIDTKKKQLFRYSEHAGFLDIDHKKVDKIIVSGTTMRVDREDEEIYLPGNIPEAFDYEYIFHTHPPTPKPGGRAVDGILYEFPSASDMLHFIDHFNDGKTIGSLVMTAEGLYNIRKFEKNGEKIVIDEDNFYEEVKKTSRSVQRRALEKYGVKFNNYEFHALIAQDISFIDELNRALKRYELKIDFYPRIKDAKGSWVVDTIYLPVY